MSNTIIDSNAFARRRIKEEIKNQNQIIDQIFANNAQKDADNAATTVEDDSLSGEVDKMFERIQGGPGSSDESNKNFKPVHTKLYGEFGKEQSIISVDLIARAADIVEKLEQLISEPKLAKNKEKYQTFQNNIKKIFEQLEELKNAEYTSENEARIERLKKKLEEGFNIFDAHYKLIQL